MLCNIYILYSLHLASYNPLYSTLFYLTRLSLYKFFFHIFYLDDPWADGPMDAATRKAVLKRCKEGIHKEETRSSSLQVGDDVASLHTLADQEWDPLAFINNVFPSGTQRQRQALKQFTIPKIPPQCVLEVSFSVHINFSSFIILPNQLIYCSQQI